MVSNWGPEVSNDVAAWSGTAIEDLVMQSLSVKKTSRTTLSRTKIIINYCFLISSESLIVTITSWFAIALDDYD